MSETARGTGKWREASVPHKGWTCAGIGDRGDSSSVCEMCERQAIRYVHCMRHPDYAGELGVGCVCAGRMEEDYEGAKRREGALKNAAGRRRRWLARPWNTSRNGNSYVNVDGYNVVVFSTPASVRFPSWGFKVTSPAGGFITERGLLSEDAAKLNALDAMNSIKNRER